MNWIIKVTETALRDLKKLDKQTANRILNWIEVRLQNCDNPRLWGIALINQNEWRYRIGNYRVLCELNDKVLIIKVIKIAHRKNVYK